MSKLFSEYNMSRAGETRKRLLNRYETSSESIQRKMLLNRYETSSESIQAQQAKALTEIAITLSMMYDLMRRKDMCNPNEDNLK